MPSTFDRVGSIQDRNSIVLGVFGDGLQVQETGKISEGQPSMAYCHDKAKDQFGVLDNFWWYEFNRARKVPLADGKKPKHKAVR